MPAIQPLVLLLAALLLPVSVPSDNLDPAFERIPLDQWLAAGTPSPFPVSASVSRPELSFHQRLSASVEVGIDGRDLDKRRQGELVFFVQVVDRNGTRFQNHGAIDLTKLDVNIKAANLQYSYRAFFLPGEYRLALVILDTATGEHAVSQGRFRIPAPPQNFLTDAWHDLPPVEFVDSVESPDSWYLPAVKGRLQWAASAHAPMHLNVILNVAPSASIQGSRTTPSSGLPALIPTLKILTQSAASSVSSYVELLDLARRRNVFHQEDARALDWPRLKLTLAEANTASIDVHALADSHHDAQFFVSEVRRLIRASPPQCVLVVLTTAIAFVSGEDLEPISLEALPPCQVAYIRYHAPPPVVRTMDEPLGRRGRGSFGGPMSRERALPEVTDKLAATLKPLAPKIFDVETPGEVGRALTEIQKRFR